MLIVALVLAVIGLASLVTAVVTSNELVAWVCIAASVLGVILLIIDALRERQRGDAEPAAVAESATAAPAGDAVDATYQNFDAEYPDEVDADTELGSAAPEPESESEPESEPVSAAAAPTPETVDEVADSEAVDEPPTSEGAEDSTASADEVPADTPADSPAQDEATTGTA